MELRNEFSNEWAQPANQERPLSELLASFIDHFGTCSEHHRKGDGYFFYRAYNDSLHAAVSLYSLLKGGNGTDSSLKNFIANELNRDEHKAFHDLRGCLYLQEANEQKRKLLDFFYASVKNMVSDSKLDEVKQVCETIYKKDFLWNFRDVSKFNPRIKSGLFYRTSTLTLIQRERFFEDFLLEKNIKTVIDLRTESEVLEKSYLDKSLTRFSWIHAPIDHLILLADLQKALDRDAAAKEIYRFFVLDSVGSTKLALESILNSKDSVAIHCHSGKDRTGFLVTLLHLLSGADTETLYNDYLASEMDTKKEYLDVILDQIEKKNGIENYLVFCGLSDQQITALKQMLLVH